MYYHEKRKVPMPRQAVTAWQRGPSNEARQYVITRYNPLMRTSIRRVGNSLGVLIPRPVLAAWGVGEGDSLEITRRGICVSTRPIQERLDELKRRIAVEVAATFPPALIRAHSLANLFRWEKQGSWVPAYGVWRELLTNEDNGALFAAMLGRDGHANELRQSPPYIGLLPREVTKRLNEEATG